MVSLLLILLLQGYITDFFLKTLSKERKNQGDLNGNSISNFYFTTALDVKLTQVNLNWGGGGRSFSQHHIVVLGPLNL